MRADNILYSNFALFITTFVGGICAVSSYSYYKEIQFLKKVSKDLEEQKKIATKSVSEVMSSA